MSAYTLKKNFNSGTIFKLFSRLQELNTYFFILSYKWVNFVVQLLVFNCCFNKNYKSCIKIGKADNVAENPNKKRIANAHGKTVIQNKGFVKMRSVIICYKVFLTPFCYA